MKIKYSLLLLLCIAMPSQGIGLTLMGYLKRYLHPAPMDSTCAICREDYEVNNKQTLPCRHNFHPVCILQWLATRACCPTCRRPVRLDSLPREEAENIHRIAQRNASEERERINQARLEAYNQIEAIRDRHQAMENRIIHLERRQARRNQFISQLKNNLYRKLFIIGVSVAVITYVTYRLECNDNKKQQEEIDDEWYA